MLKCRDVLIKWIVKLCEVAWEEGISRQEKDIIVPVYKGRRGECWSYRGSINLLKGTWKSHNREGEKHLEKRTFVKNNEASGGKGIDGSDIFLKDDGRKK